MKHKYLIFAGLISLMLTPLSAQSVSEKRSFIRSMPLEKNARFEIKNRYGDIHISSWKKDSVNIMAEIEAFAPNHEKLEKLLEGIEINITASGSVVRAETEFGREITDFLESIKGLTEKIIDYDSRVQINYYINIPDYVDLNIKNQFGNISMENNAGVISVDLSNGDFKANSLNRISELSLDFGDAEINSVKSGKINTSFSKYVISECGELSINSTSGRFELGKAEKINIESRRDKFFIGNIDGMSGISYFTDYHIENLGGNTDLTVKYGNFNAESIDARFENINLTSAYCDITLDIDPSASCEFEIRHTNAFVVIPDKNIKSQKETLNEDKKEYRISGTLGHNPGSRKVNIDATRGNIYLK
jgi:hypothetical protein